MKKQARFKNSKILKLIALPIILLIFFVGGFGHFKINPVQAAPDTETLRPTADGDEKAITNPASPATHYNQVDEEISDDLSTTVNTSNSTNYLRDLYTLNDSGVGAGVINSVTVYARTYWAGAANASQNWEEVSIKTNGTVYDQGFSYISERITWRLRSYTWNTNPFTSNPWTWDEINALQAGVALREAVNGGPAFAHCTQVYVEVDYTPSVGIDIAGTSNLSSGTVAVAVNSSLQSGKTGSISGGSWSISTVTVSPGDIVTVWVDSADVADESTAVTKYDGSGDISGLVLNQHVLSIGSADNQSLTVTNLGQYDNDDNEDVMHSANSSILNVDDDNVYSDEKIDILSGNTLTIDGAETLTTHDAAINGTLTSGGNSTYNVSGSWDNNATFTCSTSTVYFNAGSGTETIDSSGASTSTFYNLQHTGASTLQLITALDVNGNFSQTAGIFDVNLQNQNFAGNFSLSDGTTYTKGGTLTFDGSTLGLLTDSTSGQDLGAVVIDGSSKSAASNTNVKVTTLTIGANDTFDISSDTLTILGSGTPFTITVGGTFTIPNSTVIYAGTSATNVITTAYNNLTFTPASGTPTYSLTGNLTSGNALTGNLTINSGATLETTGSNYSLTLAGNWDNNGTFTANASTVTFNKASSIQTVDGGSSPFWHIIHSGAGTLQLDTSDLNVNGDFSQTSGIFNANSLNQNFAGAFSLSSGTTYTKGGTLTFDGSGSSAVSDATAGQQDLGAVVIDGDSKTITTSTNLRLTTLTIGTNDALNITDDTLTLLGSGTPLTKNGTFTTTNSTVIYAGTTATNITTTAYNNLILTPASGTPTYSLTNHLTGGNVITGNLTINSGATLDTTVSNYNITLGGSWNNNGTFTANNSTVTFNATSTGKTIEAGSSSFYDIIFNSATGGWTIQTDNLTATHNLTITDTAADGLTVNSVIVEVQGTYSIADAETSNTTWTSATLYLNSGSAYIVGSKNQNAETYDTLQIGADTDIRLWNSTANTFTVNASGSLYSQDHANTNGDVYLWGDYHVNTNDYWSYATDFDGTDISGSPRQVDVRIDPSATITVDSSDTLVAIGASANRTAVSRQGGSGGYGMTVANGGTINFEYTDFDYLEGTTGLNIQAGATVTSLDYTDFDNLVGSAAIDDAYITVASSVIGSGTKTITGVNFDETDVTVDFNVNRTGVDDTGYWDFDASTGTFDGEDYDGDDGVNEADPGMLKWDNSNVAPTTPTSLQTEGQTNPITVLDSTPEFSAIYNDPNATDIANKYRLQVDNDSGFGSPLWDSGALGTAMSNCNQGGRCAEISYAGDPLSTDVIYYWRIKYWDDGGFEGAWSTEEAYFQRVPIENRARFREIRLEDIIIHPTN